MLELNPGALEEGLRLFTSEPLLRLPRLLMEREQEQHKIIELEPCYLERREREVPQVAVLREDGGMVGAGLRPAGCCRFRAGLACAGVPSSWLCGETLFNLFALLKKVPEFSLVTLIPHLGA